MNVDQYAIKEPNDMYITGIILMFLIQKSVNTLLVILLILVICLRARLNIHLDLVQ
jgi:hypothetical protein